MSYAQSWLDLEKSMGGRMVMHGNAEQLRALNVRLGEILIPQLSPPSDAVKNEDGEIDGIKYRVYTPRDVVSKQQNLPVGIWTHGGGWVTGNLDADDLLCRLVAEKASSIIVSVDYRLAPEFKSPTQLDDTLTVYNWALDNAASFRGDPNMFYTIGVSAGGALALQVANVIVKDPLKRDHIKGVAAIVPCTLHWDNVPPGYQSMYKSYEENKTDVPFIDKQSMEMFYSLAAVDPKDSDTFTGLAAENHKNFPPTYFASCEKDPLRDDAFVMEAALKNAGVSTKHDTYKGLPHCFWVFPSVPEGRLFTENLVTGVKWLISQM